MLQKCFRYDSSMLLHQVCFEQDQSSMIQVFLRGGFKKKNPIFGLLAQTRGGVWGGSEGPTGLTGQFLGEKRIPKTHFLKIFTSVLGSIKNYLLRGAQNQRGGGSDEFGPKAQI